MQTLCSIRVKEMNKKGRSCPQRACSLVAERVDKQITAIQCGEWEVQIRTDELREGAASPC